MVCSAPTAEIKIGLGALRSAPAARISRVAPRLSVSMGQKLAAQAAPIFGAVVGVVLGTLIGAERQYRQRTAGLRTNVLVAVGAAAFVDLAMLLAGADGATRVIAYVVSGVGFLGAGAIFRRSGGDRVSDAIRRRPIDGDQPCIADRPLPDRGEDHVGQPHVGREIGRAVDLGRRVETRQIAPTQPPLVANT